MPKTMVARVGVTIGLLCCGSPVVASGFVYHVYDQPRALTLNTSRVAVMMPLAPAPPRDGLTSGARERRADWSMLDVPAVARSTDGVVALVDQLRATTGAFSSPVFVDDLGGHVVVTPEILVRFEPDQAAHAEVVLAGYDGLEVLDRDWAGLSGAYRVRLDVADGFEVLDLANTLARREDVRFAEPDFLLSGRGADGGSPDDPLFPSLWALSSIGQDIAICNFSGTAAGCDVDAPEAWKTTNGDPSIIVAIIDDGVQADHPDLLLDPRLVADFTDEPGLNDCDDHGTTVAGPVGALGNAYGIIGVAPGCTLASARAMVSVVPQQGPCSPAWVGRPSWTVEALAWARDLGARVTNNSNGYALPSSAIAEMYSETRVEHGMIHFASAGNSGAEGITWPASLDTVNAITSIGPLCQLHPTSSFGDGVTFAAPGGAIVTTDRTGLHGLAPGSHACVFGTSQAAPLAAGVAALVLSVAPDLSPDEVEEIMRDSAIDMGPAGHDPQFGWGRVNAAGALVLARSCPEDLDDDGAIGGSDLGTLLGAWGDCADCPADLDGSGTVDGADLGLLMASWGPCAG